MDTELRKTPRKKPQQLIYVELGHDNGGMLRDLSENGMGFRSMGPLQRGAKVPFSFSISVGELVKGEAELIWTDSEGRAGGLRFVDVKGMRGQIRDWLAREEHPAIVEDDPPKAAFAEKENTFEELSKELRGETSPAEATSAPVEAETPAIEAKDDAPVEAETSIMEAKDDAPVETETSAIEAKDDAPVEAETSTIEAKVEESAPEMSIAASTEIFPQSPAEAPFEKEISFGLEPLAPPPAPLEGTPITRWVEKVTLGWVVTAMVILTLWATTLVFHRELGRSLIWLGAKIAGPEQTNTASSQLVQPAESGTQNSPSHTNPVLAGAGTGNTKPVPGVRQTPTQDADQGNAGSVLKNEDNGQFELQQALKILHGEAQSGNISDAVQLLWRAVKRGNSDAEVALADLYRRGEGVTQSCDQARVLLSAAARKGNSLAKTRLVTIVQTGCP